MRALARELNPGREFDSLGPAAHLEYDLGLGSLERLELIRRLEETLGVSLPVDAILRARVCGDLLDLGAVAPETASGYTRLHGSSRSTAARTLTEALLLQAERLPDRPSLVFCREGVEHSTLSYARLLAEAGSLAGGLAARGVRAGDRVALMQPTGPDFVASYFAVLLLRAIPVPLYPPFRPDQIEEHVRRQSAILASAGVEVLIAFPEMAAASRLLRLHTPGLRHVVAVADLVGAPPYSPGSYSASDVALIQYTSGSTGRPKGVVLTHENLLANIRAILQGLDPRPDDIGVTWLPLYHDMGLIGTLLTAVYHGAPCVLMGPQDFLARPSRWLWAIHRYRGTVSAAPNFAYEVCAGKIPEAELAGLDLSCWRVALNGAETVRPGTLRRFQGRFAPYGLRPEALMPVYGLAEAALGVTFPPLGRPPVVDLVDRRLLEGESRAWPAREGGESLPIVSCGRALPGMEIRVVDASGRPLDDRRVGRLQFRGPSALQGYYASPEPVRDRDGWVETGDLAYLADGELYLAGRSKDIILKAGRTLHPQDLEDAACEVSGVRRGCVAAFALADSEQIVLVAETRQPGPELSEAVRRRVLEVVGIAPDRVHLVPPHSVPKTPSGKVRRQECRARYLAGTLGRRRGLAAQAAWLVSSGLAQRTLDRLLGLGLMARAAFWILLLGGPLLALGSLSPPAARRLAPPACRILLGLLGVRLEVRGTPPPRGACVVVSNHTSRFDPVILLAAWGRPLSFAVAGWAARGLVRPLMKPFGHLPVERGRAVQATLESMRALLAGGSCLAAFPEGGLEHAPGLRPFTLGAFEAAARAGVPVVPVSLWGSRAVMPDRRFAPRPGRVVVTIGEPLASPDASWSAVVAASLEARRVIARDCGEPLLDSRLRRED